MRSSVPPLHRRLFNAAFVPSVLRRYLDRTRFYCTPGGGGVLQHVILRRMPAGGAFQLNHGRLSELAANHCLIGTLWGAGEGMGVENGDRAAASGSSMRVIDIVQPAGVRIQKTCRSYSEVVLQTLRNESSKSPDSEYMLQTSRNECPDLEYQNTWHRGDPPSYVYNKWEPVCVYELPYEGEMEGSGGLLLSVEWAWYRTSMLISRPPTDFIYFSPDKWEWLHNIYFFHVSLFTSNWTFF